MTRQVGPWDRDFGHNLSECDEVLIRINGATYLKVMEATYDCGDGRHTLLFKDGTELSPYDGTCYEVVGS